MTAEMLSFVKALSQAERLKVIGILAQGQASLTEISAQLSMSMTDTANHLEELQKAELVSIHAGLYNLNTAALEGLVKRELAGKRAEKYQPKEPTNENAQKVLAAFLNADGTLKQIPLQPAKLRVVLNYLINAFEVGASYTEKEVNMILRRFHLDTAGLRRDLVDAGFLARISDGSKYWRTEEK